jgi:hypothetical protein
METDRMGDRLYRRCLECLEGAAGAPCPSCGGTGFSPVDYTLSDIQKLKNLVIEIGESVRFIERSQGPPPTRPTKRSPC